MFDFDGVIVDSLEVFSTAFIDACAAAGMPASPRRPISWRSWRTTSTPACARAAWTTRTSRRCCAGSATRWSAPGTGSSRSRSCRRSSRSSPTRAPWSSSPRAPSEVVEGWLRTHEVHGVAEVAGAETARSKVEKIHALLARFPGQEVYWYVGDTAGDIREAREAGVTPVGVSWGWHEPELLHRGRRGAHRRLAGRAARHRRAGAARRLLRRRLDAAARRAGLSVGRRGRSSTSSSSSSSGSGRPSGPSPISRHTRRCRARSGIVNAQRTSREGGHRRRPR